jgi:hypothetical protein
MEVCEMRDGEKIFTYVIIAVILSFGVIGGIALYDLAFIYPVAAQNAREQCIEQGFDQHKMFDKFPLSSEPRGVKCEFAERYTDLGVRT